MASEMAGMYEVEFQEEEGIKPTCIPVPGSFALCQWSLHFDEAEAYSEGAVLFHGRNLFVTKLSLGHATVEPGVTQLVLLASTWLQEEW